MKKLLAFICVAVMLLAVGCQQTPQEPEHVHTLIHNEAKAPTCVNNGIKEHWYCPGCNARFADEAATEEVTFADLETEELGHTPAEDDGDCSTAVACTVCGQEARPAGAHTPNADDGDCTTEITCSVCGKVTTPAAEAHTPNADDGDCTTAITCSVCGKETTPAAEAHIPNADDGDCTTAITCSVCGKETTPAAEAHTPNADDGDCTTEITCSVCGKVTTPAAEAHTPNADDGDCTTAITCSVCGKVTTPAAEAHTPNADDGDCTTAITCSVCGKETTPAKNHDFGINNPTCGTCGTENPNYVAPAGNFKDGVGFDAAGNQYLFVGSTDGIAIERVTYADIGVAAPENGGTYALKVSHANHCWPNFRVNFGTTLEAGTVITFNFYGNYNSANSGKYVKLEIAGGSKGFATSMDPNQVVWTLAETWNVATITLTADSDYVDLFYNVADGQHGDVPSWILMDNFKAVKPAVPTGDFTQGIGFDVEGNELLFAALTQGTGIDRVTYADAGVSAPANGGSFALKVSHANNCWPNFRINFGKTLKAGTVITFDFYGNYDYDAAAGVNKYVKLEIAGGSKGFAKSEDPNQVIWTLVETWRVATITLTADSDHLDLFYNVADGGHGDVSSWVLMDNFKAVEPVDLYAGVNFEADEHKIMFAGTTGGIAIDRAAYADAGVTAPANGGSYAMKISHANNCWPNFRINFGTTLKAGTVITFDFYGNYDYVVSDGGYKYVKLEIAGGSKESATTENPSFVVWTLVETWNVATITLTADCDHLDLFYNVADGQHGEVPSYILIDNFKAN